MKSKVSTKRKRAVPKKQDIMQASRPHPARIVNDPITSLPVLSAGPSAPVMTGQDVEDILASFP